MIADRLRKLRSLAVDKGLELVGDCFCPWAKWISLLVKALVLENDDEAKRFIARVFGRSTSSHVVPIRSPFQIVLSTFRSASEEVLCDAAKMAASVLVVCRLSVLMLVMVIGGLGWNWLLFLHVGLCVAGHTNLPFQAFHVCLYVSDAIATPPTFSCRFLLHLVTSVCVFFSQFDSRGISMEPLLCFPCICIMLFYSPLWFNGGICLLLIVSDFPYWASATPDDLFDLVMCCTWVCVIRGLVYVSAGGFCGALFLFLGSVVLVCVEESDNAPLELVVPLPLVCALLSCFYTPVWVGLFCTSSVICTLAAAYDNVKAILWWFGWLAALHSLSCACSPNFDVIAMCFLGAYFSYGCIL